MKTGNFTGNFAKFSPKKTSAVQETAESQRLFPKFASAINRESIIENRDFGRVRQGKSNVGAAYPFRHLLLLQKPETSVAGSDDERT